MKKTKLRATAKIKNDRPKQWCQLDPGGLEER